MKALKVSIVVIIIVMVGYLWVKPYEKTSNQAVTIQDRNVYKTGNVEPVASSSSAPISMKPIVESETEGLASADNPWHSRANFEEVERWKVGRGYYSQDDLQMYKTYSRDVIEQLAEGGDIKAIYTLVDLNVAAGAAQQEAVNLYMHAAMLGPSQALDWAGLMSTADRRMSKFQVPDGDELYKKEMIEALAIYQVALIRGDREVMERINEARSQVELTAEDKNFIEKRADEIYTGLEEKRKAHGLGPFDNSVPPIVRNYQDEALRGFKTFIEQQ